jgi:hypothetical protein
MAGVCVSDLSAIVTNADTIRQLKPDTGNVFFIKEAIASMTDHQIITLFSAIDELCRAAKQLSTLEVEIKTRITAIDGKGAIVSDLKEEDTEENREYNAALGRRGGLFGVGRSL